MFSWALNFFCFWCRIPLVFGLLCAEWCVQPFVAFWDRLFLDRLLLDRVLLDLLAQGGSH